MVLCAFTIWTGWRTVRVNEQVNSAAVTLRMAKESVEHMTARLERERSEVIHAFVELRQELQRLSEPLGETPREYDRRTPWSRDRLRGGGR